MWAGRLRNLRHLRLTGWPHMDQRSLASILQRCPSLQLVQTPWRSPPAPEIATATEPSEQQLQALHSYEQGQAFCRTWRLKLQHRQATHAACVTAPYFQLVFQNARTSLPVLMQPAGVCPPCRHAGLRL